MKQIQRPVSLTKIWWEIQCIKVAGRDLFLECLFISHFLKPLRFSFSFILINQAPDSLSIRVHQRSFNFQLRYPPFLIQGGGFKHQTHSNFPFLFLSNQLDIPRCPSPPTSDIFRRAFCFWDVDDAFYFTLIYYI